MAVQSNVNDLKDFLTQAGKAGLRLPGILFAKVSGENNQVILKHGNMIKVVLIFFIRQKLLVPKIKAIFATEY